MPCRSNFQLEFLKANLVLIAVDEAHCIVEWFAMQVWLEYACNVLCRGSNFRPSFKSIGGLRALVDVPLMVLSASASPSVVKSIIELLDLKVPIDIFHNFDRPNLNYWSSLMNVTGLFKRYILKGRGWEGETLVKEYRLRATIESEAFLYDP